ncbi:MAG: T9SS type A sorting domain-containing protein, partial [Bacteroidetes bacterium]|nr:T9SS type A sorting domain-containing protein [Bacteroidota bacterium]
EQTTQPSNFVLYQNYPNPFNPATTIRFTLQVSSLTSLKVFDILGREVAALVNEQLKPGTYEVEFNAPGLSSGVYFYRLSAGGKSRTRKLILIR